MPIITQHLADGTVQLLYGNTAGKYVGARLVRDGAMHHLPAAVERFIVDLANEKTELVRAIQQYQPAGSPPPGGPVELAHWVLLSLAKGQRPAHWKTGPGRL